MKRINRLYIITPQLQPTVCDTLSLQPVNLHAIPNFTTNFFKSVLLWCAKQAYSNVCGLCM